MPQWAEHHPSALVVVRSKAGLYLKHKFLNEQTPLLVNVIVDHCRSKTSARRKRNTDRSAYGR